MMLATYLPQDRRRALSLGQTLPDRTQGAGLFADISGFTPLTESLNRQFGPRRGIEELTRQINTVYDALIAAIEGYGGAVLGFAGDAITCWFDGRIAGDEAATLRAVAAALSMQSAMAAFPQLGLKVAVATGPARRFVVGDPGIQRLDALAGTTVSRLATAEQLAQRGEVLLDENSVTALAGIAAVREWRLAETGERFAVVERLAQTPMATPAGGLPNLDADSLRAWVLPAVFEREQSGQGVFLTELRPAVALFLRFTGLDYEEEEAGEKLDSLIRRMQAILQQHGGALLQLVIGDKGSYLYAAFGAPVTHEDDARRSLKAALDLRQAAAEFPFLAPLQIGLSQGVMRTGAYGGSTRRTYGVLGDDVNLAARLMSQSQPGEILVTSRLQSVTAGDFTFEARSPIQLKGKSEAIPIFSVIGRQQRRAIRLPEPAYALPMVGRQKEMAAVSDKMALALKGTGQIVGIVAEAGMGKSRLIAEVISLARRQGFAGYGGACQSDSVNTPYLAWKAIWAAIFNLDPATPQDKLLHHLEKEVLALAPDYVEALPLLRVILDLPIPDNEFTRSLEPKDRKNVLHALLEVCLKSVAHEEPVLLVIEDLHWIDALSLGLLEEMARAMAAWPVLIVLAYRPPQASNVSLGGLAALPHFSQIELGELSPAECEQAIQSKLAQLYPARSGHVPPELVEKLMARAQGNPFYLEELLNYLRDRGLDPRNPADIEKIELPDSLHTLILSRIDQLSEREKTTLRVASIIGRLFQAGWLTGYYPPLGELSQVKTDLDELNALDITPLDTPEPELAYLFKHIVTHEVAYESLPLATRTQLHEELARYLETTEWAALLFDTLAHHYGRSANLAKQREYLQKAGDAAQAAFATEAALDYFNRLLPLLDEPRRRLEVVIKRGTILEIRGMWPESEADYRTALSLSEQLGDVASVAHCQRMLGKSFGLRSDYTAALTWLEQARDTFTRLGDEAGLAVTLVEIGRVWHHKGEYAQARQELERGLALARAANNKPTVALALSNLGSAANNQGDYATARAIYEEGLALLREIGDKRGIAISLNDLGLTAMWQGDYGVAQRLYDEGLALLRQMGDKRGIATTLNNLGIVAYHLGDPAAARRYHEGSLVLRRELDEKMAVAASLNNLGVLAQERGEFAEARRLYEESLQLRRQIGVKRGIALSLINLGNLAVGQADIAAAGGTYRESLLLCQEIGYKVGIICSLSGLAAVAAGQVDWPRAARLAAAADTLRLSTGMAWETAEGRIYEQAVTAAHDGLGEALFTARWAEGAAMALDEAVNYGAGN